MGAHVRLLVLFGILLAIVFALPGSVLQAQPLGPAFPDEIRDMISGAAATPPPRGGTAARTAPLGPEAFGGDVLVSPVTTGAQNEPEGAINKWIDIAGGIDRFIHNAGANDYRLGDTRCGVYQSLDGGATYVDRGLLPLLTARTDLLQAGDPDMAWSSQGYLYYSCLYFKRVGGGSSDGTIGVFRSTDGGATFPFQRIVANGSSTVFNDKEFIAVDTNSRSPFLGRVYICWTEFSSTGARIKFKRSETAGDTWVPAAGLILSSSTANQGCDVAVGPDGDVYVVWLDSAAVAGGNNSNGIIKARRSIDGGVTFQAVHNLATVGGPTSLAHFGGNGLSTYRINNFPRIATDRQGHVFVVFGSNRTYGSQVAVGLDIWVWRGSSALGSLGIVRVNAGRTSLNQFFPAIHVSDNPAPPPASYGTTTSHGRIHVCYLDHSFSTSGFAGDWDTACTHSDKPDGPAGSWIAPARVSSCSSFDANFGGPYFIGDYIGVAMSQGSADIPGILGLGHVHPYFVKACGGNQDIFSDTGTPAAPPGPGAPPGESTP